jgi:ankyrin repeat protein
VDQPRPTDGQTPLDVAIAEGNTEVARVLKQAHAGRAGEKQQGVESQNRQYVVLTELAMVDTDSSSSTTSSSSVAAIWTRRSVREWPQPNMHSIEFVM